MADNFTSERAQAIVAIVRRYPNGATLRDIARDLPDAPGTRTLRAWAERIQLGGWVTVEGTGESTIVRVTTAGASAATAAPASTAGPTQAPPALPKSATAMPAASAVSAPPPAASTPRPVVAGVADSGAPVAEVRDRGPSAETSPSGTQPAPPMPPATAAADAGTEQMMIEAVQYVVAYGIVPESAIFHLQGAARKEGLSVPAAVAFVDRLIALLTTLSAAEAVARYGLSEAQYEQWDEHCTLAGYPRQTANGATGGDTIANTPPTPPLAPAAATPGVTNRDRSGAIPGSPDRAVSGSNPGTVPRRAGAAVRDHGEPFVAPSTNLPNATAAASIRTSAAPNARQPGSTRAAPSRRGLSTTGWVAAVLAAGTGLYQYRNQLPFAAVTAATTSAAPGSYPGGAGSQPTPGPTRAGNLPPAPPLPTEIPPNPESAVRTPQFPAATGAYVLSGARWVPLPHNNSQVITIDDDRPMPAGAVGLLLFSGSEPSLRVPPDALIAYVGAQGWTAAQLARYPALGNEQMYPPVELAVLSRDESGVRSTWWSELLPGVTGIGARRVAAALEHPAANVIVLRPLVPLAAGAYAVTSGLQSFEFTVE